MHSCYLFLLRHHYFRGLKMIRRHSLMEFFRCFLPPLDNKQEKERRNRMFNNTIRRITINIFSTLLFFIVTPPKLQWEARMTSNIVLQIGIVTRLFLLFLCVLCSSCNSSCHSHTLSPLFSQYNNEHNG